MKTSNEVIAKLSLNPRLPPTICRIKILNFKKLRLTAFYGSGKIPAIKPNIKCVDGEKYPG